MQQPRHSIAALADRLQLADHCMQLWTALAKPQISLHLVAAMGTLQRPMQHVLSSVQECIVLMVDGRLPCVLCRRWRLPADRPRRKPNSVSGMQSMQAPLVALVRPKQLQMQPLGQSRWPAFPKRSLSLHDM